MKLSSRLSFYSVRSCDVNTHKVNILHKIHYRKLLSKVFQELRLNRGSLLMHFTEGLTELGRVILGVPLFSTEMKNREMPK